MAQAPSSHPTEPGAAPEPDPSMDDILASIRRILNDDESAAKKPADGVLMLDPSMIVEDDPGPSRRMDEEREPEVAQPASAAVEPVPPGAASNPVADAHVKPESERPTLATPNEAAHSDLMIDESPPAPINGPRDAMPVSSLVAPAAVAAAQSSVDSLMRTLAAERSAAVSRGLVTIEDLVREEIRPLLKAWLDNHLPPLVERLVQAEIERVVGRNAG